MYNTRDYKDFSFLNKGVFGRVGIAIKTPLADHINKGYSLTEADKAAFNFLDDLNNKYTRAVSRTRTDHTRHARMRENNSGAILCKVINVILGYVVKI